MENNGYIERYRMQSIILGNRNGNSLNQPVIEGNATNLKSHLLQIKGNAQGQYIDSHHKETPSTITILREKKKGLEKSWEQHCLDQLKIGNPRPKQMPVQMQEEKEKLEARIAVAKEEISWLEGKLQEAQRQQKESRPSILMAPQHWSSGTLRHGVLVEIGPWKVEPDSEGLLRISDPDSPYFQMPVWKFRAEVTLPLSMEFVHRHKKEETETVAEGRPKKAVKYPEPPSWNPETDVVEYHGISNDVIKKLKKEN